MAKSMKLKIWISIIAIAIINLIFIPMVRSYLFKVESQTTAIISYKKGNEVQIFDNCVGVENDKGMDIYDKKNGQFLWRFDNITAIIAGRFSPENDALFILNRKHEFIKFNFCTGQQEWAVKLGSNLSRDNKIVAADGKVLIAIRYGVDSTGFHLFDAQDGVLLDKIIYGKKAQKIDLVEADSFLKQDLDWSAIDYFHDLKAVYYEPTRKIFFLKNRLIKAADYLLAKKITYDNLYIYKRSCNKQNKLDSLKIEQKFNPKLRAVKKNYMIVGAERNGTGVHVSVYDLNDFKKVLYEMELERKIITSDGFHIIEREGRKVIFKNIKTKIERVLELPQGIKVIKAVADEHYLHLMIRKGSESSIETKKEDNPYLDLIEKKHGNFNNEFMYIVPLDFAEK